jgi:DNA-binding transcriptional ArsR family regulator
LSHDIASIFVALSDPARLAAVRLLRQGPRRSSELAEELDLSRPLMSRHLGVLRRAGLVEESAKEDDARVRNYRLARGPFAALRSWLDEVEAFWGDQLEAFKMHAERHLAKGRASAVKRRGPGRDRAP